MIRVQQAVVSLRPNIEWSMSGDDVEGITWHTPDAQPLTVVEVEAEVLRLEQAAIDADAVKVAARLSAESKLAALGLTVDEITSLIGNQ